MQDSSPPTTHDVVTKLASIVNSREKKHNVEAKFVDQLRERKSNFHLSKADKIEEVKQARIRGDYEIAFVKLNGGNAEIAAKDNEDLCCSLLTDLSVMSHVLFAAQEKIGPISNSIKTLKNDSMPISFEISKYLHSLGYFGQTNLLCWLKTENHITEALKEFVSNNAELQSGIFDSLGTHNYQNYVNLAIAEAAYELGQYGLAHDIFKSYSEKNPPNTKKYMSVWEGLIISSGNLMMHQNFWISMSFPKRYLYF